MQTEGGAVKLSVVTTMYRSAPYLAEFHRRTSAAATRLTPDYEILFVDDGSPDDAGQVARALCDRDPRCAVIELARNFGQHKAIMTGLAHARGERVFLIDCDLEESPEWLADFDAVMNRECVDVVYGVQARRKGRWFERVSGDAFYSLLRALSSVGVPRNQVMTRLMRRPYVQALVTHEDRELFLAGLFMVTGFRQRALTVVKGFKGESAYNMRRKLAMALNAVTSCGTRPLMLVFLLGLGIVTLATAAAAAETFRKVAFGGPPSGWTSLIVSIWLLGGLSIFCTGVVGLYVAKVFAETKRRPYTVIRDIYRADAGAQEPSRDVRAVA